MPEEYGRQRWPVFEEQLHDTTDADLFVVGEAFEPSGELVGALNVPSHASEYATRDIMRQKLYFGDYSLFVIPWTDADRVQKFITEDIPNRVAADKAYQKTKRGI